MKYYEFLDKVRDIMRQYAEGAILASEAFNAIVFYAQQVDDSEEIDENNT